MAILHSHLTESAASHGVGQRPHLAPCHTVISDEKYIFGLHPCSCNSTAEIQNFLSEEGSEGGFSYASS